MIEKSEKFQFIQEVMHSLENDFYSIEGAYQLLKKESGACRIAIETNNFPQYMRVLNDNTKIFKNRMANFHELIRCENGAFQTYTEAIDLRLLITKVIDHWEDLWAEKGINIRVKFAKDFPNEIESDQRRVFAIVENLLLNAISYSKSNGTVSIKIRKVGAVPGWTKKAWEIIVEDNGQGMTQEQIDAVLSYTVSERYCLEKYAGVGLLVTYLIVESIFKGNMFIDSREAGGTKIACSIP